MLVREDFERNNFTKLGRVTGLGRGAKSFGKKILQYLHDRVEEGGRIGGNLWRPLHHATNHVWDFGKSVSSRPLFKGLARGFLSSLRILFPPFTATPPLPFSSNHPRDLGIFLFPFPLLLFPPRSTSLFLATLLTIHR